MDYYRSIISSLIRFEMKYSYYYLSILFLIFFYLIFRFRKEIFHSIEFKKLKYYILTIMSITIIIITSFSPLQDYINSRAQDYKSAGAVYSETQEYLLCEYWNGNECIGQKRMEKAPGYPFILSIVFRIFGISTKNAIYFNFIISLTIPILLFFIFVNQNIDKNISFFLSVLFAINSFFRANATQTETLNVSNFFLIFSFFIMSTYFKSDDSNSKSGLMILLLYSFLILGFIRGEYFIYSLLFIILNIRKFTKIFISKNKLLVVFFIIFLIILMLHNITEMGAHRGRDGGFISVRYLLEDSHRYHFLDKFFVHDLMIFLLPFFIISLVSLSNKNRFEFYPIFFFLLMTTSFLIFHGPDGTRYFTIQATTFFIIAGIGIEKMKCKNKYINSIPITIILITLIIFSSINMYVNGKPVINGNDFYNIMDSIEQENSLVIFVTQTLMSNNYVDYKFAGLSSFRSYNFRNEKIFEISKEYEKVYLVDIPRGHLEESIVENYEFELIKEVNSAGKYIRLYELIRKNETSESQI